MQEQTGILIEACEIAYPKARQDVGRLMFLSLLISPNPKIQDVTHGPDYT